MKEGFVWNFTVFVIWVPKACICFSVGVLVSLSWRSGNRAGTFAVVALRPGPCARRGVREKNMQVLT